MWLFTTSFRIDTNIHRVERLFDRVKKVKKTADRNLSLILSGLPVAMHKELLAKEQLSRHFMKTNLFRTDLWLIACQDHRPLQDVHQLTNISLPGVFSQTRHRRRT